MYLHDNELGYAVSQLSTVPGHTHLDYKLQRLFPDNVMLLEFDKWCDSLCRGVVEFRRGTLGMYGVAVRSP